MHLSFTLHTQLLPDLALCKLVESSRIVATDQRLQLAGVHTSKWSFTPDDTMQAALQTLANMPLKNLSTFIKSACFCRWMP